MSPSEAMPITTVTKITGAVTVLISCRNASASHLESVAGPGATRPNTIPAAIATRTQNHNCLRTERSSRLSPYRARAKVRGGNRAVVLVVVVVVENVLDAEPRGPPADPPGHRRRRHRGR